MKFRSLTFDAKKKTVKGNFKPSTKAEAQFYKQLKKVARATGHIIDTHIAHVPHEDVDAILDHLVRNDPKLQRDLKLYSQKLEPWARRQSAKLLQSVQRSNKRAYQRKAKTIGVLLNEQVAENDVGDVAVRLMIEQVALIQSIPLEAGLRAQKIAREAVMTGTRARPDQDTVAELQKQLGLSTEVAESRAQLIAITETARATASINQARAMAVGSNSYRWHNSGDEAVRHSHRIYKGKPLQGRIFSWDDPPTLDDGMTGHPGTFPRCRCFAEPVFDVE
jgi:SPP1 gp7 family putative phage head morphogenesis protein